MIDTVAIIETNRELTPGYRLLTLNFEQEIAARAGQFAMLKAHAAFEPLLRRALAVYRIHGPRQLSFLYQVLGRGTQALAELGTGGKVDALLALGNAWPIGDELREFQFIASRAMSHTGEAAQSDRPRKAIVVAGGIGSASVLMLCAGLQAAHIETEIFFGAASHRVALGCGLEDFRALDLPLALATDDGSLGEKGFVTAPLERHLRAGGGADATIYACGPWVMMRRVAEIAAAFHVACLVSLEAPMGCGFGVCVGCVIAVESDAPLGYESYKRVCVDGSIFAAQRIRWEVNAMTH
ncbi:MAG: dihydroorotate dehydrogenase electron transfer subunit [Blastocatellia bacterium]